jgi:hypothetical protein
MCAHDAAEVVAHLKAAKDTLAFPPPREDVPLRSSCEIWVNEEKSLLDSCPWTGVRDFDRRMRTLDCDARAWQELFDGMLTGECLSVISAYDVSQIRDLCRQPLLPYVRQYVRESPATEHASAALPFDATALMMRAGAVEKTIIERLQQDCQQLANMKRTSKR